MRLGQKSSYIGRQVQVAHWVAQIDLKLSFEMWIYLSTGSKPKQMSERNQKWETGKVNSNLLTTNYAIA